MDRVEEKEDRVLVYIREVRGTHSQDQGIRVFRFFFPDSLCHLSLSSSFFFTVTDGHTHPPQLGSDTGAPSAEHEASRGQDL